tara:strand:- start:2061 stop:2441 length:381 start_codon:yes stop_codon:yes gene_type:complete
MAGLLYLPRLFVYHCSAQPGTDKSETFKVMERRLFRAIMGPAMIASWVSGCLLLPAAVTDLEDLTWLQLKLGCVLAMTVAHMFMGSWRRAFAEDRNQHGDRYFRFANEVPTVLMIFIVIFVIVKPF